MPHTSPAPAGVNGAEPFATHPPLAELKFPGCRRVRLSASELELFDGRFEFWDADAQTAWQHESPSDTHEAVVDRLGRLTARVAALRGAPIRTLHAPRLFIRHPDGTPQRILQPDRAVFLWQGASRRADAIEVGADSLPDTVLEVDHTTDAQRGKLAIYQAWGFPEVWVEVPEPSRKRVVAPSLRRPGLTIHRLRNGLYRNAQASAAFPGWTAQQIHRALNEEDQSRKTAADLVRVAEGLAKPSSAAWNDALLFGPAPASGAASDVKGWEQSLELVEILESRGIVPTKALAKRFHMIARMPVPALIRAAFQCRDAGDLVGRIDEWERVGRKEQGNLATSVGST